MLVFTDDRNRYINEDIALFPSLRVPCTNPHLNAGQQDIWISSIDLHADTVDLASRASGCQHRSPASVTASYLSERHRARVRQPCEKAGDRGWFMFSTQPRDPNGRD